MTRYQPFEQRIAAKPVGAVHSRASRFTAGVELFDGSSGETVDLNAADHVVGAGTHGNQVFSNIDSKGGANFSDPGEAGVQAFSGNMTAIDIHIRMVGLLHFL